MNALNHNIKMAIVDSRFPNIRTGFRIAEFNWYLRNLSEVNVFSGTSNFLHFFNEYKVLYPQNEDNIYSIYDSQIDMYNNKYFYDCDLFYFLFLSNTATSLPLVHYYEKPFVFTLYPGSGFRINDCANERLLWQVFRSPFFKKVIVTQTCLRDYLLDKKFVTENQIEFIYGVVTNPPTKDVNKIYYPSKRTFDICFVANKYMEKGLDKGYDTFIDVCKKLYNIDNSIRFHVVGGFNEADIDVTELEDAIQFYGTRNTDFFTEFYAKMDIMISPSRPFVISKGSFDGFPTTCCVDAALNECFVFSTDPLDCNIFFEDNKHLCIINHNVDDIVGKVIQYKNDLPRLYECSKLGKEKFSEIFSLSNQMNQRLKVFDDVLGNMDS